MQFCCCTLFHAALSPGPNKVPRYSRSDPMKCHGATEQMFGTKSSVKSQFFYVLEPATSIERAAARKVEKTIWHTGLGLSRNLPSWTSMRRTHMSKWQRRLGGLSSGWRWPSGANDADIAGRMQWLGPRRKSGRTSVLCASALQPCDSSLTPKWGHLAEDLLCDSTECAHRYGALVCVERSFGPRDYSRSPLT